MTAALLALALILSVLVFGIAMILLYEWVAVRKRDDNIYTISSYWTRFHRGKLVLLVGLGVALTALYVFLMGDLVLEVW